MHYMHLHAWLKLKDALRPATGDYSRCHSALWSDLPLRPFEFELAIHYLAAEGAVVAQGTCGVRRLVESRQHLHSSSVRSCSLPSQLHSFKEASWLDAPHKPQARGTRMGRMGRRRDTVAAAQLRCYRTPASCWFRQVCRRPQPPAGRR
jgi:hypothetical protein